MRYPLHLGLEERFAEDGHGFSRRQAQFCITGSNLIGLLNVASLPSNSTSKRHIADQDSDRSFRRLALGEVCGSVNAADEHIGLLFICRPLEMGQSVAELGICLAGPNARDDHSHNQQDDAYGEQWDDRSASRMENSRTLPSSSKSESVCSKGLFISRLASLCLQLHTKLATSPPPTKVIAYCV